MRWYPSEALLECRNQVLERLLSRLHLLRRSVKSLGGSGRIHLGDKDKFLPTNHGFDGLFGNLYHLNAEEEPEELEDPDHPKNPSSKSTSGRGWVSHRHNLQASDHAKAVCGKSARTV